MNKTKRNNVISYTRDAEFFFRIGIKHADRKEFGTALRYLGRAIEMEPANADYQFNAAGILAELKEFEESNNILQNIVKNINSKLYECYFGIGCNYFDMGDFKKAASSFKKYLRNDPEGMFSDEAQNALYYLDIYDGSGSSRDDFPKKGPTQQKATGRGKGKYAKVCSSREPLDFRSSKKSYWNERHEDILKCAVAHRQEMYGKNYESDLRGMFSSLLNEIQHENMYRTKKSEIWAAALEYLYCENHGTQVTKTYLAQKYNISIASIRNILKYFNK